MPLSQNNQLLADRLESISSLDNRYEQIKLVNFDSVSDEKRGCFSLVFRAYDRIEGKFVALKFFDISPSAFLTDYRRQAFCREHEILQTLLGKERCLQLESALNVFELTVDSPTGPFTMPCQYFAVEWVDEDIDEFFLQNYLFDPVQKLKLFNEIVLGIEALHRHEVFHRDIKCDNLRAYQKALERVVIAIDLGTAARASSKYLQDAYTLPVGARGYASPEALCGLAGHRLLAPSTDKYALGCLLFELFNKDYCYYALRARNHYYDPTLFAMGSFVQGSNNENEQLSKWKIALMKHSAGFNPVVIDGFGSDIPRGIAFILNEVTQGLTNVDFSKRPKLEWVRKRIWTAIAVLQNNKLYQHKVKIEKEMRRRRKEKLAQKEIKLRKYLSKKGGCNVN